MRRDSINLEDILVSMTLK